MKSYNDYILFQTEDFLSDAAFKAWIVQPESEADAYWRGLLRTHPHLKESFQQARLLALGLESSQVKFSDVYTDQLFEKIEPRLKPDLKSVKILTWRRWAAVAAFIAILITAGLLGNNYYFQPTTHQTNFAETQSLTLYDGSKVTLNANSKLYVPARYSWKKQRVVRLDGEAYFAIAKKIEHETNNYRKFTVQTATAKVEVYGTQFNVYARHEQTKVLLDEGKVRLIEAQTQAAVDISPGQLVKVSANQPVPHITKMLSNEAKQLTSWKQNLLIFEDADMEEVERRFEEVYGLKLVLKGEAFENERFQGELPINNLDEALLILSVTFEQKPIRNGNRIYFVPNE